MSESAAWVVIPTYNEIDNIERLIKRLFELPIEGLHVLIVDDSSPDGTGNKATELRQEYSHLHVLSRHKKEGLGRAYVAGFKYALEGGAEAVVQMDADFSHDPADIPRLLRALTAADEVIGSRYKHGISVINWPLSRLVISLTANWYAAIITGMPFKDSTGGFKAWRARTLLDMDIESIDADGYGFQIVTTWRAWKLKKKICEVPIVFTERREGQSKMSRSIVWEGAWIVWRLRFSSFSEEQ